MTVFAGLWRFSGRLDEPNVASTVSMMVRGQLADPSGTATIERSVVTAAGDAGTASFGHYPVPSDAWPIQRSGTADSPIRLFAFDGRIDNRRDLFARLGHADDDGLDDASLFRLCYDRWRDALADVVLGDFAFAVWDRDRRELTLGRDPTGQRPLHYYRGEGFVAFASMPEGLLGLPEIPRSLAVDRLRSFVLDGPSPGADTIYSGISKVEPAHLVTIGRSGLRSRRYWEMPTGELRYATPDDYVEAYREQLDRAVTVRLRGGGNLIAAHLSAGLDSSAVTSTAARLMAASGGRVLAITSAPRAGFPGPVPHGRIADESPLAAVLAARYANIDHLVLRSQGGSPFDTLDSDARLFGQPVGYPCNNMWWGRANAIASAYGAAVMLTGEMGNLTITAGSLPVLSDFVRAGRPWRWLREVIALERGEPRWRGLLAASFEPWIPQGLRAALSRFSAAGASADTQVLVRRGTGVTAAPGPVPWGRSDRATRWSLLGRFDSGNFRKGAWLKWGIDERDPTSDRRLVEFCFRLPPEQLVGGGRTRRLARLALSDRVPSEILDGPRGYQFADWFETIDRPSLAEVAARVSESPTASQAIDFDVVDRMIAAWPPADLASASAIGSYRIGLLRALSAGVFALNADR